MFAKNIPFHITILFLPSVAMYIYVHTVATDLLNFCKFFINNVTVQMTKILFYCDVINKLKGIQL